MTQLAGFVIGISLTNFLNQIYFRLEVPPAQLARMQTRQAIEYIKYVMILRDMTSVYTIGSGLCSIRSYNSSLFGRSPRTYGTRSDKILLLRPNGTRRYSDYSRSVGPTAPLHAPPRAPCLKAQLAGRRPVSPPFYVK
jgi:hypothetical protein